MSGHSKWNNIKNKKGKEDARKGKVFTKLARLITVATRQGGANPDFNPQLKVAIDKAKAENLPNDNIERAIKKGAGEDDSSNFETITYEGYGPSGIAVMVKCLTDNRNRTAPDIRHIFDKNGGNLGTPGCVSFMFQEKGIIGILKSDDMDLDEFILSALDYGAEDVVDRGDAVEIVTVPEGYHDVRKKLEEDGYEFVESDITFVAQNYSKLSDEDDIKKMDKLIDALEDNDDVQDVYTNWDQED